MKKPDIIAGLTEEQIKAAYEYYLKLQGIKSAREAVEQYIESYPESFKSFGVQSDVILSDDNLASILAEAKKILEDNGNNTPAKNIWYLAITKYLRGMRTIGEEEQR